ncbi:MAG: cytochrome P450 [Microthrixaceae bacterium]
METAPVITVATAAQAVAALRSKHLSQALYDAGEVVMADVLVTLHGTEHRDRRRLENRLFRKDTHVHYERDLFPGIIEQTISPYVAEGTAELVSLGHQLMMNLAAVTSGVDRPLGTAEESLHLYDYLMRFIEGATLAHYTGDVDAKRAEVAAALEAFDAEFMQPSVARRRDLIAQVEAGTLDESELPRDVLTVLLRNQEDLDLPPDVVLRETCYFLLASAHTSATAFTRTLHNLFAWLGEHPEDVERVRADRMFVQRCVHETVRLAPSSPVAMRWAQEAIELPGDVSVPEGAKVVVDMVAVNRDPSVWGEDADTFDPTREVPDHAQPWGLSFGSGMHACIGQDLAAGLPYSSDRPMEDHLFGLVPVAVQWVLDHGVAPDPEDPAELDATSERGYWKRYPVVFQR